MIIFLTGTTGSGKTDTCWALVSELDELVFLDCDWFASRTPFSWKQIEDVESVYRAIASQIAFHISEGRRHFVVTLTLEMARVFQSNTETFIASGLPIHAFRLVASDKTFRDRILGRDRLQKEEELENALRQNAEFDCLCADERIFVPLETDGLGAGDVARTIVARIRSARDEAI